MLERVEEVEAPNDASLEGQLEFLIDQFCTEQFLGTSREELLLGRPIVEEGRVLFRSPDLLSFIEKRRIKVSAKEMWNILRERGAKTQQFNVKNRCVRCWSIPEVPRQNDTFQLPDVSPGDEF